MKIKNTLVAVRFQDGSTQIFQFASKADAVEFMEEIKARFKGVEYAFA